VTRVPTGAINTHGNKGDRYEAELDNVAKEQQIFVAKIPQKSSSFLKKYDVKR
jgi:hypothetical protein